MDFVFGTLATDELKLLDHRVARRGVRHAYDHDPLDPLPGQPVTIRVHIGPDVSADHVSCYYTTDGSEPAGERGKASTGQAVALKPIRTEWDTLLWGYMTLWEGTLPAQDEGTLVRYLVGAWTDDGDTDTYADWPDAKVTTEQGAQAFFTGKPLPDESDYAIPKRPTLFAYHVDTFRVPKWAHDAVIYQIFVDRFYPGDGRDWLTPESLSGFYGGTLWGVRDKLDYIAELGATVIWLTPIFPSPTHHGYDTTDYRSVEPRLGGEAALRALVDTAHERGIRVLLDVACNHLSDQHPYFQDALHNPDSPYRDWFLFDDSEIGYRGFFGVKSMPEINARNPDARAWLIETGRYWLEHFDVDGYRLDYAQGLGIDFWPEFRAACRAVKPDCLMFGEIVLAPDGQRTLAGRLDGVLDFHVEDVLRKTYGWKVMSEAQYERFVAGHLAYFPADFVMPSFVDNHDMDRFLFISRGDVDALKQAAAAQMRLPGPPIIYYGTEVGVTQQLSKEEGAGLEESRQPMLWGDAQNKDLLAYYRKLIAERRSALSE